MKEKKIFCIYGYFSESRYIKEIENHIIRHRWIYRHTFIYRYTNNPHWQISWMLYNYLRYTRRLFLLLPVILYSFMRKQGGKIELQKKAQRRICVRNITFLTTRHPFYVIFCCFLRLLPLASQVSYLLNGSYKDIWNCYGSYSVWWYHDWTVENMKISCNLILAGWHL